MIGVNAGDERGVVLDFGDRDLDVVDDETVGLMQIDATGRRTRGDGRDLGFDVIKRGRDADRGLEAQAARDDVFAVEGVAVVEDRTGEGDQGRVGIGGDAAEEDVYLRVEAHVAVGRDEAAVIVLRDRADGGDEVDRASAGGRDVGAVGEDDVERGDQGDVAGAGVNVGIGRDARASADRLDQDKAGAVSGDGGIVGGRGAVVERDVAVERA